MPTYISSTDCSGESSWLAIQESSLSTHSSLILYYRCSQILQILYSFKFKQANSKLQRPALWKYGRVHSAVGANCHPDSVHKFREDS